MQTSMSARLLTTVIVISGVMASISVVAAPTAAATPRAVRTGGPPPGTVYTVAGGGLGEGVATQISQHPFGLAMFGSTLYISDDQANVVRALDTTTGLETMVAGTGVAGSAGDGGPATAAQVSNPSGLAVDASGNLYITTVSFATPSDNRIRKVTPGGVITTVAGGGTSTAEDVDATTALLTGPRGVAVNGAGDLFIADTGHNEVRMVNHVTGHIVTVAGNGTIGNGGDGGAATSAQLHGPWDVWVNGSSVLIADWGNFVVRSFTVGGNISTIAGNGNFSGTPPCPSGPALTTTLFYIEGVSVDGSGNVFFTSSSCVLEDSGGTISVVAGNGQFGFGTGGLGDGGPATSATLAYPTRAIADSSGNVYLADYYDLKVRVVNHVSHIITTVAGNGGVCSWSGDGGDALKAEMCNPGAVAVDGSGDIFVADVGGARDTVREVTLDGKINTVAGNGTRGQTGDGGPATSAQLDFPSALAVDSSGNLYIAEWLGNDVRRVDHATHQITRYAGNGNNCFYNGDGGPPTGPFACIASPAGIVFDSSGNLLILDAGHYIHQVSANGLTITTRLTLSFSAGGDSLGGIDGAGNIYTSGINAGVWKNGVQQIATGRVHGVAVGPQGEVIMGGDDGRIYGVDDLGGKVPIAGVTSGGSTAEGVPALSTAIPYVGAMNFDAAGNLFYIDFSARRVRRITPYLAPDAPTSVTSTLNGTTASVSWTAPANVTGLPVARYLVTTQSPTDTIPVVQLTGAPPPSTATVSGLKVHRRYSFTVRAWNGWLSSPDSSPPTAFVTPLLDGGQIVTYAGGAPSGGPATAVGQAPFALSAGGGSGLLVTDLANPVVRQASGGFESGVAGNDAFDFSGDGGPATAAGIRGAGGVVQCPATNAIYIADTFNYRIRKVSGGVISTVVGNGIPGYSGDNGPGTKAQIGRVFGLACAADGGTLLLADSDNGAVRVLDGLTGNITTLWYGFGFPTGIAAVRTDILLVADSAANVVWYLDHSLGGGCIFAGNTYGPSFACTSGSAPLTALHVPRGIAFDGATLYIAEQGANRVRAVDFVSDNITTFAGTGAAGFSGDGGPATSAKLNLPTSVALSMGSLYVADYGNLRVRQIDLGTRLITTAAGNGTPSLSGDGVDATAVGFGNPYAVAVDGVGNEYFVDNYDNMVRKVDLDGLITTVAGTGQPGYSGDGGPATAARLNDPRGVAVDANGDVFISDTGNNVVRIVDPTSHNISTYATGFAFPRGLAVDALGNLFVADTGNNRVRKVDHASHAVTTVAGNGNPTYSGDGGPASSAGLNGPRGLAFDSQGHLFISDSDNNVVREVNGGTITTVVGKGSPGAFGDGGLATNAFLNFPFGLAFDGAGNLLIADTANQRIRKVGTDGRITTIAGACGPGFGGDGGLAAQAKLNFPYGVAVDSNGTALIADSSSNRIRALRGYVTQREIVCQSPPAGAPFRAVRIDAGSGGSRSLPGIGAAPQWQATKPDAGRDVRDAGRVSLGGHKSAWAPGPNRPGTTRASTDVPSSAATPGTTPIDRARVPAAAVAVSYAPSLAMMAPAAVGMLALLMVVFGIAGIGARRRRRPK